MEDRFNSHQLFNKILAEYDPNFIAKKLGLNSNTVSRWYQTGVPSHYRGDFLRILGKQTDNRGGARDKDQFYTKTETAAYCYKKFHTVAKNLKVSLSPYTFVEPGAGCGSFYNVLPKNRRIGIDIEPQVKNANEILVRDYLTWRPERAGKYAVIGNPPFGLRGHLALQFINHSSVFADMVAFILPPLFNSDGKGVPAKRIIKKYKRAYTENLPDNSFQYPNGKEVSVSVCFQVWTKINTHYIKQEIKHTCSGFHYGLFVIRRRHAE